MYHIRLVKSCSYKGIVSANKAKPDVYTEDKAAADKAVASGFFKLIEDEDEQTESENQTGRPDCEKLADMTKAELTEYAEKNGVSLEGCSTKTQILKAICTAFGGSAAMIDLQE
ncbi:MAG: hypothetical protein LUG91_00750 [Ruminococcus sp.]|nr:hypothetical protein [Ruminococcus sp.]